MSTSDFRCGSILFGVAAEEIERAARAVDWNTLGADAEGVVTALTRLLAVQTEADGDRLYAEVLDAIGHNHSGWLYDAAGPAAAYLAMIVRETEDWARRTALEILIDCMDWVRPEQRFLDAGGTSRSVRETLRDAVAGLEPLLHTTINDLNASELLRRSATELLQSAHRQIER